MNPIVFTPLLLYPTCLEITAGQVFHGFCCYSYRVDTVIAISRSAIHIRSNEAACLVFSEWYRISVVSTVCSVKWVTRKLSVWILQVYWRLMHRNQPLSMTSAAITKLWTQSTFKMMAGHLVEFVRCFCSKSDNFMGNLSPNTIKYVYDQVLYIILSTLEKI